MKRKKRAKIFSSMKSNFNTLLFPIIFGIILTLNISIGLLGNTPHWTEETIGWIRMTTIPFYILFAVVPIFLIVGDAPIGPSTAVWIYSLAVFLSVRNSIFETVGLTVVHSYIPNNLLFQLSPLIIISFISMLVEFAPSHRDPPIQTINSTSFLIVFCMLLACALKFDYYKLYAWLSLLVGLFTTVGSHRWLPSIQSWMTIGERGEFFLPLSVGISVCALLLGQLSYLTLAPVTINTFIVLMMDPHLSATTNNLLLLLKTFKR